MRNLLITLVLCAIARVAAAGCPATTMATPQTLPAAELISSAAAQPHIGSNAAQPGAMMLPASVHAGATHVMGGPPVAGPAPTETRREGSKLAMVLAALGVMLVIVLRRLGASS